MIQRLCGAPKGSGRDQRSSDKYSEAISAKRFQSAGHTARVPSVAMSVYIATMTHTAVTFTAYFRIGARR